RKDVVARTRATATTCRIRLDESPPRDNDSLSTNRMIAR
ncbi:unnamed protein product, partial [Amoebophrya sp. A25]